MATETVTFTPPTGMTAAEFSEAVELLCSAHEIASREGKDTNWPVFLSSLKKCLASFRRNGVTERTYRLCREEHGEPK